MRIELRFLALGCALAILVAACSDDSSLSVVNNQAPANASSQDKADIVGQVLDATGQPLAGVLLVPTPFSRSFTVAGDQRRIIETFRSDAQGRFLIPQQPFGTYALKAIASGHIPASRPVGLVDFSPQNLRNGQITKDFSLQAFPLRDDGDIPPVALFDVEDKKRMSELLASRGIRFEEISGRLDRLERSRYRVLVVGHDATVYNAFNELIDQKALVNRFLDEGGHVVLGQLNDFSVEARPLPFLDGERGFILHTEDAPFNDFNSGKIRAGDHPLVQGLLFGNWSFIEPGQTALKNNVTFDAAVKSSFQGPNWQIIATAPESDFTSGRGTVSAESDVIIAEYTDPAQGGRILVNQAAYYQGSFGDLVDPNALALTENMLAYIKHLNRP
ncbi:MAG: carboxypeptidase regulatory-like domain-containing protein [Gammaproteobacteria bacterium]|nr:carboxypeptidase regulatory-like domain-containing protein [Gammaproteobacteria bacterium]